MSTALLPYGQPLYWSFHERPEAWHIDPFHQYAKQLVFFGGGRFTHSTHYHDSSLYGNHGVLTNMDPATDWVRDLGRWALDFDGSDDYVTIGTRNLLGTKTAATWACWLKPTTLAAGLGILDCYNTTGNQRSWRITAVTTSPSVVIIQFGDPADGTFEGQAQTTAAALTNGTAVHLAVTYQPSAVTFYVNGSVVASSVTSGAIPSSLRNVTEPEKIGGRADGYYWSGLQSDPMIWSRVLSPSEITPLADHGNVMLSLGGSDPGLLVPDDLVYPVYLPSSVVAGAKPALWLGVCV